MSDIKILKNNTNVDVVLPDINNLVVPANGQVIVDDILKLRQSYDVEVGLNDHSRGTNLHTLTYNDSFDDLHLYIAEHCIKIDSAHGQHDRKNDRAYDYRRSINLSFGAGLSTASTSYTTVARFVHKGRLLCPPPKRIVIVAKQSVTVGSFRLMDATNNVVLAEVLDFTAGVPTIVEVTRAAYSNWSEFEMLVELQAKTDGGVLPNITIYSLDLFN